MNDHTRTYQKRSLLAVGIFIALLLLQVQWLHRAAQFRQQLEQKKLELLAPDIALQINALDHDAFHADLQQHLRIPDEIIDSIVHRALREDQFEGEAVYAIYQDTIDGIFRSNKPSLEKELRESPARACMSCIVSFSTLPKQSLDLYKQDPQSRMELLKTATFQYYRPVTRIGEDDNILWFALYQPSVWSKTVKSMTWLFAVNILLLGLLLYLFYHLLISLSRHKKIAQVKEDFFNNVTHEIKTPLSSIRLASKMLKNFPNEDKKAQYLALIEKESLQLEKQVDQLLDLSLIEHHGLDLNRQLHSIQEVIDQSIHRLQPIIEKKQAKIRMAAPPQPIIWEVDRFQLINAIVNLIENSLKYSHHGVEIGISYAQIEGGLEILVTDNGPGIEPEHRDHIFKRFYRGQKQNQYKGTGFGIGLSYVKQIVEAHGGSIFLDTSNSIGTTFRITL